MRSVEKSIMDKKYAYCCLPDGCARKFSELISLKDPGDAVKIVCTNEQCTDSQWMHKGCFADWEHEVISFLRMSNGLSEFRSCQAVWSKSGFEQLAIRACLCRCGTGYIRKDTTYSPPPEFDDDRLTRRRKSDIPLTSYTSAGSNGPMNIRRQLLLGQQRSRTGSISSTGSSNNGGSPPMSLGTSPPASLSPGGLAAASSWSRFDFLDAEHAALGCIFKRRTDFTVFASLPRGQQNPYHIKIEDDGLHGNDETRFLLLTTLSRCQAKHMPCVLCRTPLEIFDEYPLIDGTFFLSPVRYLTDVQLQHDHKPMYLNAVCMRCMSAFVAASKAAASAGGTSPRKQEAATDSAAKPQGHQGHGSVPKCVACQTAWNGNSLLIGTMYSYDVFAAAPCCPYRLSCKSCRAVVLDPGTQLPFFSDYSKPAQCPFCYSRDYHFIKPVDEAFVHSVAARV